jgi:4-hydroxy-3-methylbut-2-en-1-yl diphosphate synthase IspG/GcpE
MGCRNDYDPADYHRDETSKLKAQHADEINKLEAMLCAVIGVDVSVIDEIDDASAGITCDDIRQWYVEHKRKDEERLAKEAIRKRIAEYEETIAELKLKL